MARAEPERVRAVNTDAGKNVDSVGRTSELNDFDRFYERSLKTGDVVKSKRLHHSDNTRRVFGRGSNEKIQIACEARIAMISDRMTPNDDVLNIVRVHQCDKLSQIFLQLHRNCSGTHR